MCIYCQVNETRLTQNNKLLFILNTFLHFGARHDIKDDKTKKYPW